MIKDLDLHELETVSGGTLSERYGGFLVGEAPPQRIVAEPAQDAPPPHSYITTEPVTQPYIPYLPSADRPFSFSEHGPNPFDWSRILGLSDENAHAAGPHTTPETNRAADISMEHRARQPATITWKTNYLSNYR